MFAIFSALLTAGILAFVASKSVSYCVLAATYQSYLLLTRSPAMAEGPRDALVSIDKSPGPIM